MFGTSKDGQSPNYGSSLARMCVRFCPKALKQHLAIKGVTITVDIYFLVS
jgi:hypothetical protein